MGGEAITFPGQGVEPFDLARILGSHRDHPLVDRLAAVVGTDSWATLDLLDTRIAQPAVYTASVVQAFAEGSIEPTSFVAAAGHSLGELSAFAYAGAFDPLAGLDLVVRRAELGHEQHRRRPGRMLVVMRLDEPAVEWVRRSVVALGGGVLEIAVVNGPGQFVLSGDVEATAIAMDLIAAAGGVGRPLTIGGAYHSPLMADAVDALADAITAMELRDPAIPVVSCTTHAVVRSSDQIAASLSRALVLPVRWVETVEALVALGATIALDAGPSRTLANLARYAPILKYRALSPDPKAR